MDAQEMTGILSALLASGAVKPQYVAGLELAAALMAGTVGEVTFDAEEAKEEAEEAEEEAEEVDADADAEEEARGHFRVRRQSDGAYVMHVGKTSKWTRDESCAASWDNTRGARISAGGTPSETPARLRLLTSQPARRASATRAATWQCPDGPTYPTED